ncbi:MAG: bifunctional hydroxymethylpyrimidine kinase/phosphomethylpyrimidine kinase [Verrucomicrobia bacterium]|nr:bifunctional hydroxymethylpyrimidine kinase/phosphomethylpyrimidine kinase [Verrucomicrobiota bacterium]
MSKVLIVGSAALDSIKTPKANKPKLLGGAACYASVASSYFAPTSIVAVVGEDFPKKYVDLLKDHKLDLSDFKEAKGKTFYWSGEYEENMNNRRTLCLELGVFADFKPELTAKNRSTPFVMLGNITPELQMHVLEQMKDPVFVLADTMDFHIKGSPVALKKLLKKIDCLSLNDSEAKLLTGKENLLEAASRIHKMGPSVVIIKKGEYGAMLSYGGGIFLAPAYPLAKAVDPTGAGDTFAGGLMGYLASHAATKADVDKHLRKAILAGTVIASYCCEDFGFLKVAKLDKKMIRQRISDLEKMILF